MHIIGNSGPGMAVTVANYLESKAIPVFMVGKVPRTDMTTTGKYQWCRTDFGSASDVIGVVNDNQELWESGERVESITFIPPHPEESDPRLSDQLHFSRAAHELVYGPMMMYRYLEQFGMLAPACRVLFVQPVALFRPEIGPWYSAVLQYKMLLKCLDLEYGMKRIGDTFSMLRYRVDDIDIEDEVTRNVERHLLDTDPSSTVWGI